MAYWFADSPRIVSFTVGALESGDTVLFDVQHPGNSETIDEVTTSISSLTTGAGTFEYTPDEPGTYKAWPRIMTGTILKAASGYKEFDVYALGSVEEL